MSQKFMGQWDQNFRDFGIDEYKYVNVQKGDFVIAKSYNSTTGWVACSVYPSTEKGYIHSSVVRFFENKVKDVKKTPVDLTSEHESLKAIKQSWWEPYTKDMSIGSLYEDLFNAILDIANEYFQIRKIRTMLRDMVSLKEDSQKAFEFTSKFVKFQDECSNLIGSEMICYRTKGKDTGKLADETNSTSIELYKLYSEKDQRNEKYSQFVKQKLDVIKNEKSSQNLKRKGSFVTVPDLTLSQVDLHESISHLALEVKKFEFDVPDRFDLHLQLYSDVAKQFVSEPYVIQVKEGNNIKWKKECLFRDLEKKDFESKLYLVCKCYRIGDFKRLEKKSGGNIKRPHAIAVFALTPLVLKSLVEGDAITESLTMYTCKEELFYKFHQVLIESAGVTQNIQDLPGMEKPEFIKNPLNIRLVMYERRYSHLIQEQDNLKTLPVVELCKLPDVMDLSIQRNDVYVTINNVYLTGLGTKLLKKTENQYRNLLVKMRVFQAPEKTNSKTPGDCVLLNNVISISGEKLAEYQTTVYHHVPNPTFWEHIHINLTPQQVEKTFFVFTFYKVSTKKNIVETTPFGFGYTKLVTSNGMIGLPFSQIPVYKYETNIENKLEIISHDDSFKNKHATKSWIDIKMTVCSNKIATHEGLPELLKLKDPEVLKNETQVQTILKNFAKVKVDNGIMNFLGQIFDLVFPFFDVFTNENTLEDLVKLILVVLHPISHIPRFREYKSVVCEYFEKSITSVNIWKIFLKYLNKSLDGYLNPTLELTETMKTLSFMMQLIHVSRHKYEATLQDAKTDKQGYNDDIMRVVIKMVEIIRLDSNQPKYGSLKVLLIVHMGNTFDYIVPNFDFKEASLIIGRFLEHVKLTRQTEHLLTVIDALVSGEIFKTNARNSYLEYIIPVLCDILDDTSPKSDADKSLSAMDRYKRVIKIISSIMHIFEEMTNFNKMSGPDDVKTFTLLTTLLPSLLGVFERVHQERIDASEKVNLKDIKQDRTTVIKREIVSIFVAFLHVANYEMLLALEKEAKTNIAFFFRVIYHLFKIEDLISDKWIYNLYLFHSILSCLIHIGRIFEESSDFMVERWTEFFVCSFKFSKIKLLQIELSRSRVMKRQIQEAGDLRFKVLTLAREKWNSLKENQNSFIPTLIDYIIPAYEVVKNERARQELLTIFMGMVSREHQVEKDVSLCEGETQKCLVTSSMDPTKTKAFITELDKRFRDDPALAQVGPQFITHLYELLSSINEVGRYDDSQEDLKTDACIRVMGSFLKHSNHDLYFCYLFKLSEMHQGLNNFSEAARCLLLYASRLKFTESRILPFFAERFPKQLEKDRKEQLYKEIIHLFDKDTDWENAIKYSKELLQHYEDTYEYLKIKEYSTFIGECYENIMIKNRAAKSYFFVEIFGKKADDRGKYIYKEDKMMISDFIEKLKKKRPEIEVIKSGSVEKLDDQDGIYIRVNSVFPASAYEIQSSDIKLIKEIPPQILEYYQSFGVYTFKKTRLFNTFEEKYKKKPRNEYKHLCRENLFYSIDPEISLIRRKNPVIKIAEVIMNPLQNAMNDLNEKIKEISSLLIRKKTRGLERVLTGTIDAAVQGGEAHYIDAFFSNKAIKTADKETLRNLETFRKTLRTNLDMLYEGLLFMRSVKSQNDLVDYLTKKLKEKEKNLTPIFVHPLNPDLIILTSEDMKDDELEALTLGSFRISVVPSGDAPLLSPKSSFAFIDGKMSLTDKLNIGKNSVAQSMPVPRGEGDVFRDISQELSSSEDVHSSSLRSRPNSSRGSKSEEIFDDLEFTSVDDHMRDFNK